MAFGGIVFALFAKGEELPWAKQTQDNEQGDTDSISRIETTDWDYDWMSYLIVYHIYIYEYSPGIEMYVCVMYVDDMLH